ncbi:MAG: hypothetical protein UDB11_08225 [Peptococcaceae bacterium]|nr:hypothetical protein [Peptococcaceae bacterium]
MLPFTFIKKLLSALLLFSACFFVSGCATEATADRFTDFTHTEAQYLASLDNLQWPEGFVLPTTLEGEDKNTLFDATYGDTRASNLWEYAWIQEWLNSYDNDPARAERALAQLEGAFDMPYMSTARCDNATRRALRENLDKAQQGDPSGFADYLGINSAD